MQIKGALL